MPFVRRRPFFSICDHFKAAGFEKPERTSKLEAQMDAIKSKGASKCIMALPGDYNGLLENYSAVNDHLRHQAERHRWARQSFVFNKHPWTN